MPLILPSNSISAGGYEVDNSLRFNSGSSDYLNKTFGSAGNRKTWTFSTWFKRGNLGVRLVFLSGKDGSFPEGLNINTSNQFEYDHDIAGTDYTLTSDMLFRDVNAWYHLVVTKDTTQATETDRLKVYVNGNQITLNEVALGYPPQNYDGAINKNVSHTIGNLSTSDTYYFNGYLAETYLIDGQALDPTSFGEFDADTGIWKPIAYEGTYGTNGFFLEFKDSSALGDDTSNNSNDFTVNNLTSIDQSTDTPTNNFATMNPLASQAGSNASSTTNTFSDGNLTVADTASETAIGNLGVDTGKWFWEVKVLTDQDGLAIGGANQYYHLDAELGYNSPSSPSDAKVFGYYGGNGTKFITIGDGSQFTSYGSAIAVNNIIGVALNLDDNEVTFYLDGVTQGTFSITALGSGENYFPAVGNWSVATTTVSFNFGSPPFAITTGNADANGYGNFEYAVPSGYYALNTKNLAEYG
jgi:hypothetical protein